ncbi:MAG: aspartate-semialdehyde dehydrogenase [Bdellovibrionales bacterium]|nr:aspartate-semialdehyde dehydrogenase [Bdellovibrionales bacterium]
MTPISRPINIGIVGATGIVGETFMQLLDERKIPVQSLRLFASEQSLGKKKKFRDQDISMDVLSRDGFKGLDLVFFSSGDPISKEWAPIAVESGAFAVDNSAAFRMDPQTALVVPEINFDHIKNPKTPQIIANPNCSTIQMVLPLHALKHLGLSSVHVASYQAVSGSGRDGIDDLKKQSAEYLKGEKPSAGVNFKKPISFDCHPIIGGLDDDGFCSEENKIVAETKKILSLPELKVSAFTVRVPTMNSHAEAVWVTVDKTVQKADIIECLKNYQGVQVLEDPSQFHLVNEVSGKNDVYVSRIRQSRDFPNTWMMWVVADNVRRGAATNGIFIAEKLFS